MIDMLLVLLDGHGSDHHENDSRGPHNGDAFDQDLNTPCQDDDGREDKKGPDCFSVVSLSP